MSTEKKRRSDDEELMALLEQEESARPEEASKAKSVAKVEFKNWFTAALQKSRRLQAHHYPVILAYAQLHKLSELEPAAKYDELLKKFGY